LSSLAGGRYQDGLAVTSMRAKADSFARRARPIQQANGDARRWALPQRLVRPCRYPDRMRHQRLKSVVVEGFTSIRSVTLALHDLNVLVGANGAGKSNFIRALSMLGRIVDNELGLFVGLSGGANALLSIDKAVPRLIRLGVESEAGEYTAELTAAAGDALIFNNETIWVRDTGVVMSLGRGHRETALTASEPLWVPGAAPLVETLRGCRVFHFHDTSSVAPVKQQGYIADNRALHPDAGNLAAVILNLQNNGDRARYQRIVRTVKHVAPFFRDFVLEPELNADRVRLRWRQEGSDTVLPADALSDGTLRFICLTVLLGQAELPGLIILDEPELGLHPFAIVQLAEMLRTASRESQVLLATQSVTLMNQFELDDLIVVERQEGSSVFERPDPGRLGEWLAEYSLGELWEKNMLGGRPRPERR
jgi:predicted ATPase